MVADHPFGVGLMDWEVEYPPYDQGEQMQPGRSWRRPHNDYLWFAAEYGIPSFLVYVAFLVSVALTAWRIAHRAEDPLFTSIVVAAATGFIALHGNAFFSFPRERIGPYALAWLSMALIASISRRDKPTSAVPWAFPLASVIITTIALTVGVRAALSNHWNWTGYSYYLAQRSMEGEAWVNRSAELGVFDFQQLLRKSQVHQDAGNRPAAITANFKVLKLHPNSMAARWNLANLHALTGDDSTAEHFYSSLLELHPTYIPAYRDLGAVYRRMGRTKEAWETCEAGLAISPTDQKLNYVYGSLHQAEGNLAEASSHYRLAGNTEAALRALSQVAQTLGRSQEATTALETLVGMGSATAADYYPLAALYQNARLHEKALGAYEKFVELWTDEDDAKARALERITHLQQIVAHTKNEGNAH